MTDGRMGFEGKAALITGAASGIGRATAQWLDRSGIASLVLVDIDAARLAEVSVRCDVRRYSCDVADPSLWEQLEREVDRLDCAVINAGGPPSGGTIVDTSFDDWRRVTGVHFDGAFLGLRTAMRLMHNGGSVVMLSSVGGLRALANTADYAAAKAGVIQLARVGAVEGALRRIRVNAIAPGGVDTGIWDRMTYFNQAVAAQGGDRAAVVAAMGAQETPSGRWATPDELADNIAFLLSDMSTNITGALIVSDGGRSL